VVASGAFTPGHAQQRGHARRHLARADALEALRHQAAVVGVQPHHVGHGAQGDQGQQGSRRGCWAASNTPRWRSSARSCQQHVEHHAHPGDGFARERAARLVGVDDGVGLRQFGAGQVVVGDQHRRPSALAWATPSTLAMPLSTVMSRSAPRSFTRRAMAG
jgi:hypothetical protein